MQLDRMRMYQAAERLVGEVDNLLPRARTRALDQADHLDRSASSVLFNTAEGIGTNRVPPDQWRLGLVIAAHGVATNADGDVFVSEFSTFGRVHKFDRR